MAVDKFIDNLTYPLSLLSTPIWLFDVDRLCVVWANSGALSLWNAPSLEELQHRNMSDGISRKVSERLNQYCDDLTGSITRVSEHWTFYPKGRPITYECSITAIESPRDQRWLMVHAINQDKVSESDTLYRSSALLHTSVCVSVFDRQGRLKYSNPAARRMLGTSSVTLKERFVEKYDWRVASVRLAQYAEANIEALVVTSTGQAWHSLTLELCPDPVSGQNSILVSETDVSDRRAAQQLVHQLAYSDTLTGLPNRTSWLNTLEDRLECARRDKICLGVLFVDLDRFKLINDTLGHALGDQLLVAVAKRLQSCVGEGQYIARLGGDEFTLLLEDSPSGTQSSKMAKILVDALAKPMEVEGHELSVTPSIGISLFPQHASNGNMLMQQADLAMYAAKESSTGFRVFQPYMTTQIQRRLLIENDLREAIEKNVLEVYFQPKLNARDGRLVGMEALIRWNHVSLGWVPPTDFIAVAEETGIIGEITRYVLYEALRQQTIWSAYGNTLSVAVNVSPYEFRLGDFAAMVRDALAVTGCNPEFVELEITETMLMTDSTAVQGILASLNSLGVKLSIDDFGSGYSNLGYLQVFPLNSLKIDRSFLGEGDISPVIDLIIGMGKTLSLTVVAEGVETVEQRDFLIRHGCDQLQGFLFSQPMDKVTATQFIRLNEVTRKHWPFQLAAVV